jgi:hypothetical protein
MMPHGTGMLLTAMVEDALRQLEARGANALDDEVLAEGNWSWAPAEDAPMLRQWHPPRLNLAALRTTDPAGDSPEHPTGLQRNSVKGARIGIRCRLLRIAEVSCSESDLTDNVRSD